MVDALKHMGASVDEDLHSLLAYYGEASDATDSAKPEDFFALVLNFSSALNVCLYSVELLSVLTYLPESCH
jgi:diaphanous 1